MQDFVRVGTTEQLGTWAGCGRLHFFGYSCVLDTDAEAVPSAGTPNSL